MTQPRKNSSASRIRTRDLSLSRRIPYPLGQRGGLPRAALRSAPCRQVWFLWAFYGGPTYALPLMFLTPETTWHQLHIFTHLQTYSNHCTTTKRRSGQGQNARVLYSSSTRCLTWFIHECMLWNCPSSFILK